MSLEALGGSCRAWVGWADFDPPSDYTCVSLVFQCVLNTKTYKKTLLKFILKDIQICIVTILSLITIININMTITMSIL